MEDQAMLKLNIVDFCLQFMSAMYANFAKFRDGIAFFFQSKGCLISGFK